MRYTFSFFRASNDCTDCTWASCADKIFEGYGCQFGETFWKMG